MLFVHPDLLAADGPLPAARDLHCWWGRWEGVVAVLAVTVTALVSFVVAAVVAGQESSVNVGLMSPVGGVEESNVVDRRPVDQAVDVEVDRRFGDGGRGCLGRGDAHCHGKLEEFVAVGAVKSLISSAKSERSSESGKAWPSEFEWVVPSAARCSRSSAVGAA